MKLNLLILIFILSTILIEAKLREKTDSKSRSEKASKSKLK